MKTIKKIIITPVFVKEIPNKEDMYQQKLYISEEYKTAIHLCLCGCGNEVITPLGNKGWSIRVSMSDKIHMEPSIASNNLECKSHYIITNGIANFV